MVIKMDDSFRIGPLTQCELARQDAKACKTDSVCKPSTHEICENPYYALLQGAPCAGNPICTTPDLEMEQFQDLLLENVLPRTRKQSAAQLSTAVDWLAERPQPLQNAATAAKGAAASQTYEHARAAGGQVLCRDMLAEAYPGCSLVKIVFTVNLFVPSDKWRLTEDSRRSKVA
ncbi:hypothetical protein ABBQ38_014894 [Trebouxia sp. C0009 RCD-2024]